ncbi:M48 family metalloprotease [Duganella sp. P38]|uniref:M48 family metalloprotease n=1 Tax=Duganella sp. P38 TaxID=3423949 RepID=UPI003D797D82
MNAATSLLAVLLFACAAHAQVPETGRAQELRFSAEEVGASMEDRYIDRTVDLAAAGKLDQDRRLLARLRYISTELIRVASELRPEVAGWRWELHTTDDPEVDAICMAGGKILVGSAFVQRLALTDGELATLLAHEVAHALAEHHRETFSEAMLVNRLPAVPLEVVMARLDSDITLQIRLWKLSSLQESEADHLGMVLAHRAGWAAADIVGFYRKLAESEQGARVSGAYPAYASRLSMAQGMARLFGE